MTLDIAPILEGWDHNPDQVISRIIEGLDGRKKVQMRLDLGLIQMELDGRPDGKRPHGSDSLLDHYRKKREEFAADKSSDVAFRLHLDDCSKLQAEGMQFYYRYLSLFHLGDYPGVVRDTVHNLEILDFIDEYASQEWDRDTLEQYRPYILMMNCRARTCLLMGENRFQEALDAVVTGLDRIRKTPIFLKHPDMKDHSREVTYLHQLAEEITRCMPEDPVETLREEMNGAVAREDFEQAARLRDQINKLRCLDN